MARVRAKAACIFLAVVALTAMACGDDEGGEPTPMGTPQCSSVSIYECYNPTLNCQGIKRCNNGVLSACMCNELPPPMNDGSVAMNDGSVVMNDGSVSMNDGSVAMNDGSVVMNDGSVVDNDATMPMPDAAPNDCAGSCVPEAPMDFEGPFLTFIGGSDPPSCGGAYDDEGPTGSAGLVAPDADCSTCSCESSGNTCATYVNLEAGGNNTCGGANVCSSTFDQACAEIDMGCVPNDAATTHARAVVPASAGACTPSAQDPDIDPAEFAQLAHTCAPNDALDGAGCDGNDLCAPDGPFNGAYCVTREGTHNCPAGPYSDRHVFFGGVEDTRDCSACACDRDCDYTLELFPDADDTCAGTAAATLSIESPNVSQETSNCEAAPVGTGGTLRAAFSVTGTGSCTPSGGQPEGNATGTDPITFCCLE